MKYKVRLEKNVIKELEKLPREILRRIGEKLLNLEENPRPFGIKKLVGVKGYRLRIGDYREIAEKVPQSLITAINIDYNDYFIDGKISVIPACR